MSDQGGTLASRPARLAPRALLSATLALLLALALLAPGLSAPSAARAATPDRVDPALRQQMQAEPTRLLPVIVEMRPAAPPFTGRANERLAQQALALLAQYGQPVGGLALINSAAGFASAAGISAIGLDPRVAYVHLDATVRPRAVASADDPSGQLAAAYPRAVNADRLWAQGRTGAGVAVAVLDSGIAPDPDLTRPTNRIVAAVNFAGDRGPLADAGGHGTHVAGIVAGNGVRSAGEYVGIAPGASLVDVRVLNRNGSGRVSSVVRGLEWVVAHRARYNIRVVNLSLGMPARTSYRLDPLAAAVELAWQRGLVVIAAAGNRGRGMVDSPGIDPYVVTVGATDDRGTASALDDLLGWFSAWGTPPDSTPKPDLVAPGRKIVSLRVPGSALDTRYPERITAANDGATYFRLTGTSMAAPVAAGTAALLLQQRPWLTPDQVKALLTGTTQPFGQTSGATLPDPTADGSGLLDAAAALASPPRGAANRGLRPADAAASTLYPAVYGQPLAWRDPTYAGVNWPSLTWSNLAWDNLAWDNLAWDNLAWDNLAWDNLAWDNLAWDNLAWDNLAWDNLAWDAALD